MRDNKSSNSLSTSFKSLSNNLMSSPNFLISAITSSAFSLLRFFSAISPLTLLRSAFISSALRINSRRLSSSDNTSSTTFVSIPRFATLSFKNSGSLRNSLMSNMSLSILSISIF